MMIDFLFVGKQVILATNAPIYSVTAAMNFTTVHRTAPTRFLPQEHHATKTDLIQGIGIPTTKGKNHTPPVMVPVMGDISANHNPAAIPTVTRAAVSEGTHCIPHPATTAACTTLRPMDAPIAICMTFPFGIITPHVALATSPTGISHATIPQTRASLALGTPTTLHRKHSQEKPSHGQDLQPPINPTFQACHHPGLSIRFFLRFRQGL